MSQGNHWLKSAHRKKMFKEIDDIGLEIWSEDGTFGDFIAALSDEQMAFLMDMSIRDFVSDDSDMSFGIEIVAP